MGQTTYWVNWFASLLNCGQWWSDAWFGDVMRQAMMRPRDDRCQYYIMLNVQVNKTIYWVNWFTGLSIWSAMVWFMAWWRRATGHGAIQSSPVSVLRQAQWIRSIKRFIGQINMHALLIPVSGSLTHGLVPSGDRPWSDPELTGVSIASWSMNKSGRKQPFLPRQGLTIN